MKYFGTERSICVITVVLWEKESGDKPKFHFDMLHQFINFATNQADSV